MRPSGSGPAVTERLKHWFKITIVGKGENMKKIINIQGGDPGYEETAKFISETAFSIIIDNNKLHKNKGILTPIECNGELLSKRLLDAGIKIDFNIN